MLHLQALNQRSRRASQGTIILALISYLLLALGAASNAAAVVERRGGAVFGSFGACWGTEDRASRAVAERNRRGAAFI